LGLTNRDTMPAEHEVAVVGRQWSHLGRLDDSLPDESRITRGQVTSQKGTTEPEGVHAAALDSSWPLIERKRLDVVPEIGDETLRVYGDFARLTQVFTNLISNAVNYSETGGSIRVSIMREGDEAVVRVRDRGAGIPPDAIGSLFEMFRQAPGARAGGLGIGLALVRQLVELHGGSVRAFSEGP